MAKNKGLKLALLNALPGHYIFEGDKPDTEKFKQVFDTLGAGFQYLVYDATAGDLPDSPEVADAFLVTGSPCGVYDNAPWIAPLAEFVQRCAEQQKKLVGICFGHQLIAQALGGQVEKSKEGWLLGLHRFELYRQPSWMIPARAGCSLYFINQDQVITLPPRAQRIGGSEVCPNTIFVVENRILCLQPHIEYTAAFMQAIVNYLEPGLSRAKGAEAMRSLGHGEPDNTTAARWIVNFLKNEVTQ
jgi:GMP synthase-like glutamine amidotransferase